MLVVIHAPGRRILLLRRHNPADWWQSVTGSLEWGESHLAAAAREVIEETGFQPDKLIQTSQTNTYPIHSAWRPRYAPDVFENTETVFYLPLAQELMPQLTEHAAFVWLDYEQAVQQVSSETNRRAIKVL